MIFKLAFQIFIFARNASREALQAALPEGLQQSLQGAIEGMVQFLLQVENNSSGKQYQPSADLELDNYPNRTIVIFCW
jgi:hypothetical protein